MRKLSISLDFYFYPLSWIFLPQRVALYASDDNQTWQLIAEEHPENPEILTMPSIHTVTFTSSEPLQPR